MSDLESQDLEPAPQERFDLSLEGDGIRIERRIDRDTALEIVAVVMGGSVERGAETEQRRRAGSDRAPATGRSLREYLDEIEAARNPDKIVGIANYLLTERRQERVTSADVKNAFPSAGETVPANFPRDFRWAVTNGWLGEDPNERGSYYVTETGLGAIEERFSPEIRRSTGQTHRRRGRRTSRRRANEE